MMGPMALMFISSVQVTRPLVATSPRTPEHLIFDREALRAPAHSMLSSLRSAFLLSCLFCTASPLPFAVQPSDVIVLALTAGIYPLVHRDNFSCRAPTLHSPSALLCFTP
ncbi:hypothetical protein EI94DRAFT_1730472 [Lactarius quietus]|nr:hypothetical protein EI94DRAFT_1730472 [Lactarius quietus]